MLKNAMGFAGAVGFTMVTATCVSAPVVRGRMPDPSYHQCVDQEGLAGGSKENRDSDLTTVIGKDGNVYKLPPEIPNSGSKCCSTEYNPNMKYESVLDTAIYDNVLALKKMVQEQLPDLDYSDVLFRIGRFCLYHRKAAPLNKGKICDASCITDRDFTYAGNAIEWGRTDITREQAAECNDWVATCMDPENWRDIKNMGLLDGQKDEKIDFPAPKKPEIDEKPSCVYEEKMPLDHVTKPWLHLFLSTENMLIGPAQIQAVANHCVDRALSQTVGSFKVCPNLDPAEGEKGKVAFGQARAANKNPHDFVDYWYDGRQKIGERFVIRFIPELHKCLANYESKGVKK